MRKKLLLLLGLVSISLHAQTNYQTPNYAPKSPEAAEFLKYGNYPVNLSTGVPNISIPIYTIDVPGYSLPITLDYHASGIKVNQEASWVGLGWNLNFGATITLSVKDDVDENNSQIDNMPDLEAIEDYYEDHPYDMVAGPILNQQLDKSRIKDTYYFSSPTGNCEFYISAASGEVIVFPPDAFKIETLGEGFKVTDPGGNIYSFETYERSKNQNYGQMYNQGEYKSVWYVDEISTPNTEIIEFSYVDDGITDTYTVTQRQDIISEGTQCNCPSIDSYTESVSPIITMGNHTYTFIKRISEIRFNNGNSKLIFNKINDRQDLKSGFNSNLNKNYCISRLSSIEIKQKNAQGIFQLVRGFSLNNNAYFNSTSGTNNYNMKRLKLERVEDMLTGEGHLFKYYESIALPGKDSYSVDYYGYYNGANNSNLIPPHDILDPYPVQIGNANRSISASNILAGILTEIHYPTKGWTKFNYENNRYYAGEVTTTGVLGLNDAIDGVGAGGLQVEGEFSAGEPFETQCDDECIQYSAIPFTVSSNHTGSIYVNITNDAPNGDITYVQHQFGRVRVFNNTLQQTVYDSGQKIDWEGTYNVPLIEGTSLLVIEAWGGYIHASANLTIQSGTTVTSSNPRASGLRVSSIENFEHDNTLLTKKVYEYTMPDDINKSSGSLVNGLQMSFMHPTSRNFLQNNCPETMIPSLNYEIMQSIMSVSKSGNEGNSVSYRYVKEKNINITDDTSNGYTLYKFSFGNDLSITSTLILPASWTRGKLLEKSEYRQVGSTDLLQKKEINKYINDNSKIAYYKGFKMHRYASINVPEGPNPLLIPPHLTLSYCASPPVNIHQAVGFLDFDISIPWNYLKSTEVIENFYDSNNDLTRTLKTKKTFEYNNPVHMQLSCETLVTSMGENLKTYYEYPDDNQSVNEPNRAALIDKHMINVPLNVIYYRNTEKLMRQRTVYKNWGGNNILLPELVQTYKGTETIADTRLKYNKVDTANGNILDVQQPDGKRVAYIWGYYDTLPVVKIENGSYDGIPSVYLNAIKTASNTGTQQDLLDAIDDLRIHLADAMVTGYAYEPLKGVSAITDARGNKTSYEYDNQGRLRYVKDENNNILTENEYHFKN